MPRPMYRGLDTIVLNCDLPDHGLRKGDLGAVVEVYEPDGLEVEFVTASATFALSGTTTWFLSDHAVGRCDVDG